MFYITKNIETQQHLLYILEDDELIEVTKEEATWIRKKFENVVIVEYKKLQKIITLRKQLNEEKLKNKLKKYTDKEFIHKLIDETANIIDAVILFNSFEELPDIEITLKKRRIK